MRFAFTGTNKKGCLNDILTNSNIISTKLYTLDILLFIRYYIFKCFYSDL